MVWVEAGSFKMGSLPTDGDVQKGESPQHDVAITKGYYIAKHEVTQELYESVMGYNPSSSSKGDKFPVETVNWYEAVEFCNKLSEQEGLAPVYSLSRRNPATGFPIKSMTVSANWNNTGYRLPTEAEWEYAAKGGDGSPGNFTYSGSDNLNDVAWYLGNSGNATHEVGTTPYGNGLGIYDMSGNVWEWCWDWYNDSNYYGSLPSLTDPTGPNSGTTRVMRGGCYSSEAIRTRSVNRWRHVPGYNTDTNGISEYQGFRIVCNGP
jgi:formylglycine-generating enzyme required for sulfatase activity